MIKKSNCKREMIENLWMDFRKFILIIILNNYDVNLKKKIKLDV